MWPPRDRKVCSFPSKRSSRFPSFRVKNGAYAKNYIFNRNTNFELLWQRSVIWDKLQKRFLEKRRFRLSRRWLVVEMVQMRTQSQSSTLSKRPTEFKPWLLMVFGTLSKLPTGLKLWHLLLFDILRICIVLCQWTASIEVIKFTWRAPVDYITWKRPGTDYSKKGLASAY